MCRQHLHVVYSGVHCATHHSQHTQHKDCSRWADSRKAGQAAIGPGGGYCSGCTYATLLQLAAIQGPLGDPNFSTAACPLNTILTLKIKARPQLRSAVKGLLCCPGFSPLEPRVPLHTTTTTTTQGRPTKQHEGY